MVRIKLILIVLVLAIAGVASAATSVLVIRKHDEKKADAEINMLLSFAVSQELYDDGRVNPIVWSQTDPMFRSATEEKLIVNPPDLPTIPVALKAAKVLKAEYLIIVNATYVAKGVQGTIIVQKGESILWQDKKVSDIKLGDATDMDATVQTMARTWCIKLSSGLFKQYPSVKHNVTTVDKGQTGPDVTVRPRLQVDNKTLAVTVTKLAKEGDTAALIILLRDAVDAEPLDVERRRMLVDYLMLRGEVVAAGDEAKRASLILPESPEFHVLAARAYMQSNETALAQEELNQALARDSESYEARCLLGELSALKGDLVVARNHFEAALKKGSTGDILFKMVVVQSLLNDEVSAKDTLTKYQANAGTPIEADLRYHFYTSVTDQKFDLLLKEMRSLVQNARLGRDGVKKQIEQLKMDIAGLKASLTMIEPSENYRKSHANRVLAGSLLDQALAEVEQNIQDKNFEAMLDVTLTIGEGNRQWTVAKTLFSEESLKSKSTK